MATYTWIGNVNSEPSDPFVGNWTSAADWEVGTTTPAGPPGVGDDAVFGGGTLTLDISLQNMTLTMVEPVLNGIIEATDVDLGDNFQMVVTNPDDEIGATYRVIGTGTLDDSNQTAGLTPAPGSINYTGGPLTIDLAPSAVFTDSGTMTGGELFISADSTGSFVDNTTIDTTAGFNLASGVTFSGGAVNLAGGNANIQGKVEGTTFLTSDLEPEPNTLAGIIEIGDLSTFTGSISLALSDEIQLDGVNSGESSYANGVLTLDNGETLQVTPGQDAAGLDVVPNGSVTYVFAEETPCFATGTRIATPEGDMPVEALRPGDVVQRARGGSAEVVWVGHRRVDCARHPRPHDVRPVRIAAGALGPGRPARELWLSPDHALFLHGSLIPARYLVNGATIVQVPVPAVTYHHVELARHDVLLAEGMPAESYLDTGNRGAFEGAGVTALHADFGPAAAFEIWASRSCAPLVLDGPVLATARRQALRRAAVLGARRTHKSDLRVLADGTALPTTVQDGLWQVTLPTGTREVRLRSRVWVPVEMRPEDTDTRRLGVAVARLRLDRREVALDSPGLAAGWHAPETGLRWTDGDALLLAPAARNLAFSLAMTGCYWAAPMATERMAARV